MKASAGVVWSLVCECPSHAELAETAGRSLQDLMCAAQAWSQEVEATSSSSPACPHVWDLGCILPLNSYYPCKFGVIGYAWDSAGEDIFGTQAVEVWANTSGQRVSTAMCFISKLSTYQAVLTDAFNRAGTNTSVVS